MKLGLLSESRGLIDSSAKKASAKKVGARHALRAPGAIMHSLGHAL